jgi:hypothetical protein
MRPVATTPFNTPPELRALAEDVLTTVSRVRFVTVSSLMAYAGPDGLSLDLLDVWCRAGLLHRGLVRPDPLRADEIQYLALTTAGARALYAVSGRRVEGTTSARLRRSSQKRMHDVLVGETTLAVLALGKEGRVDVVGIETDDRKMATVVHVSELGKEPERIVLQPDALIVTEGPRGREALLVEVDRSTTAPQRMQIRYRGYLAWHREGGPERDFGVRGLRVVTLVPTESRLMTLHDAALDANAARISKFLVFGLLEDFSIFTAERWLECAARSLGDTAGPRVPLLSPTRSEAA